MDTPAVTDRQLLRLVRGGDRAAMTGLVTRHIDFVYACALRQVRDAHLAADVTQAVFVILWTKAGRVTDDAVLPTWLFKTARFASANAIRMRARRARYEREAAEMRATQVEMSGSVHDVCLSRGKPSALRNSTWKSRILTSRRTRWIGSSFKSGRSTSSFRSATSRWLRGR